MLPETQGTDAHTPTAGALRVERTAGDGWLDWSGRNTGSHAVIEQGPCVQGDAMMARDVLAGNVASKVSERLSLGNTACGPADGG